MLFNNFDISGPSSKVPIFAGHMILNTVDCTRPNGGRLPQSVDLMMSDFAGGASGFPMTFYGGKYSGNFCSVVFSVFFLPSWPSTGYKSGPAQGFFLTPLIAWQSDSGFL